MEESKAGREFAYQEANFLTLALSALDTKDDVVVAVPRPLASVVERALSVRDAYFQSKKSGKRSLLLLLRFGVLGFRTPSLWAVLNKAEVRGRLVETEPSLDVLAIKLVVPRSSTAAPGASDPSPASPA